MDTPLQCVSGHARRRLRANLLPDLGWAYGDMIAGITVGIVAVPQSMSYAQVRTL